MDEFTKLFHETPVFGENDDHDRSESQESRNRNDVFAKNTSFFIENNEPNEFPIEYLGPELSEATKEIAKCIGAPIGLVGNAMMAATSMCVQGLVNTKLKDGRVIPTNAFYLTLASSGERKSAADRIVLKPHKDFQKELSKTYRVQLDQYRSDAEAFAILKRKLKIKSTLDYRMEVEKLGGEPEPPQTPFLFCEDPTVEGLFKLLGNGRPSIGVYSDEGGQILGGYGMAKDQSLKTMAAFSKLWDGDDISRVRSKDDEATRLYGKRCSMHLMMQPEIAQRLLGDEVATQQGFLSRMLLIAPRSLVGTREYSQIDVHSQPAVLKYYEMANTVLNINLPLEPGTKNQLDPREIELSSDAFEIWKFFYDFSERAQAPGGKFSGEKLIKIASKAAENAVRIATALQVFHNPEATQITSKYMESGARLMGFYLEEAIRIYNASEVSGEQREAAKMWMWLQGLDRGRFFLAEILRLGPNAYRNKSKALEVLRCLEDSGHIHQLEDGTEIDGVWRERAWEITSEPLATCDSRYSATRERIS